MMLGSGWSGRGGVTHKLVGGMCSQTHSHNFETGSGFHGVPGNWNQLDIWPQVPSTALPPCIAGGGMI